MLKKSIENAKLREPIEKKLGGVYYYASESRDLTASDLAIPSV